MLQHTNMDAGKGQAQLNTTQYIGGIYYLVVSDASGVCTTVKLVKIN
ncbi:MAG: hypothetical protein ABIN36_02770 [Ferruginibacter sp.]